MYPETDVLDVIITKSFLSKIKIPELITEKSLDLEKQFDLQPEIAKEITEKKIPFESLAKNYPRTSPKFISQILVEMPKELKTRFNVGHIFTSAEFKEILDLTNSHNLQKEAIMDMMKKIAKKQKIDPTDYKQVSFAEIEHEIKQIMGKNPNLTPNAIMGIIMQKYSRKINPKEVSDFIKKLQ